MKLSTLIAIYKAAASSWTVRTALAIICGAIGTAVATYKPGETWKQFGAEIVAAAVAAILATTRVSTGLSKGNILPTRPATK